MHSTICCLHLYFWGKIFDCRIFCFSINSVDHFTNEREQCGPGVYTNETKVEMIGPIVYYRAKETNEKHEFEAVRFSYRLKTTNGSNRFNSNMAKSLINFWNQFCVYLMLSECIKFMHSLDYNLMLFREHSSVFWSRRQVCHRKNFSMIRLRLRHSKNLSRILVM